MGARIVGDGELRTAVVASRSWRQVLRQLGFKSASGHHIAMVRARATALNIDHSHFTGRRTWTDAQLRSAVDSSRCWTDVADAVGLAPGGVGSHATLRAAAADLGLSTGHLGPRRQLAVSPEPADPANLRRAGAHLAAAWFALHGYRVSWPSEPCRYDLVVERDGAFGRVQVKTTTRRVHGDPVVSIAPSGKRGRAPYRLDEVDLFFIVDDALSAYLVPLHVVRGRQQLSLIRYPQYRVVTDGAWMGPARSQPDAVQPVTPRP